MKRMFVFLFVLLCLCFVFSYKKPSGVAFENLKGEYSLYLNTQYNSIPSFAKATNNGDGQIVQCDLSFINELKFDSKKIGGESVKVSMKDYTYDQICDILNFRSKKDYEFSDGLQTFYGEAGYGEKFVYVGTERINCEIAINNGFIYIGFPVILGSY